MKKSNLAVEPPVVPYHVRSEDKPGPTKKPAWWMTMVTLTSGEKSGVFSTSLSVNGEQVHDDRQEFGPGVYDVRFHGMFARIELV